MLIRKVRNTVLITNSNLKNTFINSNNRCFCRCSFSIPELDYCIKSIFNVKNKIKINIMVFRSLQKTLQKVPQTLKDQSAGVLQAWAHQCECVFAHRLRRGQQMFSLYTKLWEERALKDLLNRMRKQITRHGKELIASAVGVASYSWDSNRISNDDMKKYLNELDYIHLLAERTLNCDHCRRDAKKIVCKCPNQNLTKKPFDNWTRFVEKEDMVVWRKELGHSGNYEYKVYGSFDDVSGEDFLNVQIDTEYRKKWDTTAIMLEVVEKDPSPHSNSDVVYWEMLWPKLFVNRDYVFNRRFLIDHNGKTIILMSRGTQHPACPIKPDKYRVDSYWSYMVIKPYTEFDKPGIEFGLTYFDDPGVNVPSTVTTWVAMRAMPDYLTRLRVATKEYQEYCKENSNEYMYKLSRSYEPQAEMSADKSIIKIPSPLMMSIEKAIRSYVSRSKGLYMNEENKSVVNEGVVDSESKTSAPGADILTAPSPISQADTNSSESWKYLQSNYYFT